MNKIILLVLFGLGCFAFGMLVTQILEEQRTQRYALAQIGTRIAVLETDMAKRHRWIAWLKGAFKIMAILLPGKAL